MTAVTTMDLELKKAFSQMQETKIETKKKLKMIELQTEVLKTSKKKFALTDSEISQFTPDTSVYSAVGRMFVLSQIPDIKTDLKTKETKCDNLMTQLDEQKQFLVRRLQEQEDNLRDLVQQRKEADTK